MNPPVQNLDGLRDIHLPEPVSWWPPAPGWWILLAIIILAFIFVPKIIRRLKFVPLNKVAETDFSSLVASYHSHHDASLFIANLSKLLRQITMSYLGREEVAQLTGEQWISKLNSLTSNNYFTPELEELLTYAPYKKDSYQNLELLISATQNWINNLPDKPQKIKTRRVQ